MPTREAPSRGTGHFSKSERLPCCKGMWMWERDGERVLCAECLRMRMKEPLAGANVLFMATYMQITLQHGSHVPYLLSRKLHLHYQTMDANSKFSKNHPNDSNALTFANRESALTSLPTYPSWWPPVTHKSSEVGETLNCFQDNWSILQIMKLTQRVQLSIVTQLLSFWRLLLIIPISHHNLY